MRVKIYEVITPDGKWRASLDTVASFMGNFRQELVVTNRNYSLLNALLGKEKFPRTRRVPIPLGTSQNVPSALCPNIPYATDVQPGKPRLSEENIELDLTITSHYNFREKTQETKTIRISIA